MKCIIEFHLLKNYHHIDYVSLGSSVDTFSWSKNYFLCTETLMELYNFCLH